VIENDSFFGKRAYFTERKILGTIYDKIYEKAKLYLDTRQNDIHVSIVYAFAHQLLSYYPEADEDIVLPSILLHDVGWRMVPEEKQLDAFGPIVKDSETQLLHETEGARIAEEILHSLNYSEEKTREILTIIDGHDSRQEALSLNDALVKDADKLWRYAPTGVNIDHIRFGIERNSYLDYLGTMIDKWFLTSEAREMARDELGKARLEPRQ
jgi:HD superfamily phosphodiesterase